MIRAHTRDTLAAEERQTLLESARVCEMILEANSADTVALETLKEIYTKLGDRDRLMQVLSALAVFSDVSASVGVAASKADELDELPAERNPGPGHLPGPLSERRLARFGDRLIAEGLITPEQLAHALTAQKGTRQARHHPRPAGGPRGGEPPRLSVASAQRATGHADPARRIDPEVLQLVPAQIAEKYEVLPSSAGATASPWHGRPRRRARHRRRRVHDALQVAGRGLGRSRCARPSSGATTRPPERGRHDEELAASADVEVVEGEEDTWAKLDIFELKESADEAPVVRLVNMLFVDAIRRGASDIHLEPYEKVFRVRFRMDGVLHEIMTPPKRLEAALTSRVKIMANLDIAERRLPQDGRIKLRYNQREIDLRVSTLPTIFGEKTVMRILDKEALQLDLGMLGFDPWSLEQFNKAIRQPYGMILITGPTGSGKTTTLYSAIHTINSPDVNIMTAEDPVEYNLKGVNQCQVNEEIGRSFAAALRSFLRQDPDIILVGETRDLDTAQIGIRAALTGHLVLTTLHTNDCPSTVARLMDMGIPPFLVSSALTLILAQRLGRKVCKDCRQPYEADEEALVPYGHVPQGLGRVQFYKGKGCPACNFTGMKGRVAMYEVMPISEELRGLILRNAPTAEIREIALAQGMKTLRQNALQKVIEGVTTVEEVLRVTLA